MQNDSYDINIQFPGISISVAFIEDRLFEDVVISNPFTYSFHSHPSFEIQYMLSSGIRVIGEDSVALNRGDFLIISPHVRHRIPTGEKTYSCLMFMLYVSFDDDTNNEMSRLMAYFRDARDYYLISDLDNQLYSNIQRIQAEIKEKNVGYTSILNSEFACFFVRLARRVEGELTYKNLKYVKPKDADLARRIDEYLNIHYSDNITREEIAKTFFISVQQLDRLLFDLYGKSLRNLILEKRMVSAIFLVEDTKVSFSEISEKMGYNSTTAFYIAYKKYYGKTPGEMRKKP